MGVADGQLKVASSPSAAPGSKRLAIARGSVRRITQ